MNVEDLAATITDRFAGVLKMTAAGDHYFIYDPDGDLPDNRKLPFATIVTGDRFDTVSDLDRPGVYRLNIGLPKALFEARFAEPHPVDHAALDVVMPHPEYGRQHWVCVLNPQRTLDDVAALLEHAHAFAVRKHENRGRAAARESFESFLGS